jgi:hypothetical protein
MTYTRPYRYPDGEPIPTSLPDRYQPMDNPGVPQGENCGNCGYYQDGYCSKFAAKVRNYYWCAKWIKQGN